MSFFHKCSKRKQDIKLYIILYSVEKYLPSCVDLGNIFFVVEYVGILNFQPCDEFRFQMQRKQMRTALCLGSD